MKKDPNQIAKSGIAEILEKYRNHIYSRIRGGKKGGKSKWDGMTEEERVKHIQKMNKARKLKNPS